MKTKTGHWVAAAAAAAAKRDSALATRSSRSSWTPVAHNKLSDTCPYRSSRPLSLGYRDDAMRHPAGGPAASSAVVFTEPDGWRVVVRGNERARRTCGDARCPYTTDTLVSTLSDRCCHSRTLATIHVAADTTMAHLGAPLRPPRRPRSRSSPSRQLHTHEKRFPS